MTKFKYKIDWEEHNIIQYWTGYITSDNPNLTPEEAFDILWSFENDSYHSINLEDTRDGDTQNIKITKWELTTE